MGHADAFAVSGSGRGIVIQHETSPTTSLSMRVPAGILFVFPATILLFLFPTRLYWAVLWVYQMALGAVFLSLLALGMTWWTGAFSLYHVLSGPFYMGTSLAAPLLAYGLHRRSSDG